MTARADNIIMGSASAWLELPQAHRRWKKRADRPVCSGGRRAVRACWHAVQLQLAGRAPAGRIQSNQATVNEMATHALT